MDTTPVFVIQPGAFMRTSFVVGIFVLAVTAAGVMEWASRRATSPSVDGPQLVSDDTPGPAEQRPTDTNAGASERTTDARPQDVAGKTADGVTHTLVLGVGNGGFRLNGVALSEEAIARIDEMFIAIDAQLPSAHFVIEGHTDSLGSKDVNQKIGLARALAVRQYLSEQYEIPVNLMRVVSYGSEQPVADNATQEGRALNRRVVIKVLD